MTWEGRGIFEVSSADPDSATPVWVDLTVYVNDVVMTPTLRTGRQNDLDQTEPSQLQLVLNNADDRFTYGNTASPYAAWWGPGRRCRYREVIAGTTVPLFVGFLQTPTEGLVTAGIDQRVVLTAVDRLGRLQQSEPFVSTIGADVVGVGGAALTVYYPLNDPSGSIAAFGRDREALRPALFTAPGVTPQPPHDGLFTFGGGTPPPGDDLSTCLRLDPYIQTPLPGFAGAYSNFSATLSSPVAIGAGDFFTVQAWVTIEDSGATPASLFYYPIQMFGASLGMQLYRNGSSGFWEANFGFGGWVAIVTSTVKAAFGNPTLVGGRFTLSSTVAQEIWVNGVQSTAVTGGAPPASGTLASITVADGAFKGSISHVQAYKSTSTADYTFANHSAQYQVGLNGLDRQTTGDRIRTVLGYAGVPAAEMTLIDKGSSIMRPASFGGQTPLDAARDAERTEQGLLYADGAGNVVYKDRRTLYNI